MKATISDEAPSSWQVFNGQNSHNYPCDAFETRVNPPEGWQHRISGLEANTDYNAYITASNNVDGYPDLLSDNNLVSLKFTTTPDMDEDDFALPGIFTFIALIIV